MPGVDIRYSDFVTTYLAVARNLHIGSIIRQTWLPISWNRACLFTFADICRRQKFLSATCQSWRGWSQWRLQWLVYRRPTIRQDVAKNVADVILSANVADIRWRVWTGG